MYPLSPEYVTTTIADRIGEMDCIAGRSRWSLRRRHAASNA